MGIKYIGERISPRSKFSVQYNVAYESNVPISDPVKAKKVIEKYKHAIENNWIVVMNIEKRDGNRTKLSKSKKVERMYLVDDNTPTMHYIVRPSMFDFYEKKTDDNKYLSPFFVNPYREDALKFSKKQATKVKNIFIKEGIKNIHIKIYHPGLPEKYVKCYTKPLDPILSRFELMDFE